MKPLALLLLALSVFMGAASAAEGTLIMARSPNPFEPTMAALQNSIQEHGYSVAHVQKCDGGMKKFGYHSDYYRVVFFGKAEEVARISAEYPQMIPYLPLKIVVFAENDKTVLTALNPDILTGFFPDQQELRAQIRTWKQDLGAILEEIDGVTLAAY